MMRRWGWLCGVCGAVSAAAGCHAEERIELFEPGNSAAGSGAWGAAGDPAPGAGGAHVGGGWPGGAASGGSAEAGRLVHRYDFSGTGALLRDLVGGQHGEVLGGANWSGTGQLRLDGMDDYVALPSGMLAGLEEVTLVAFLTWRGVPERCWQRIFDFGSNDASTPGEAGNATSSLFVTPSTCPDQSLSAALDFQTGLQSVDAALPLVMDEPVSVALTLSDRDGSFLLYQNGELVAGQGVRAGHTLSEIEDRNNWLGRSQWIQDQGLFLAATYDEFRIYDRALSAEAVRELWLRGPDSP